VILEVESVDSRRLGVKLFHRGIVWQNELCGLCHIEMEECKRNSRRVLVDDNLGYTLSCVQHVIRQAEVERRHKGIIEGRSTRA